MRKVGQQTEMRTDKAAFFDRSYMRDWAVRDYTAEEAAKLRMYMDLSGVCPGRKVLEPGCGTGRFTEMLAERVGPDGEVVAVDISPKMIDQCRIRAGHHPNVHILNVPVEEVDYPGYFDIIFCLCVFPHFDDKPGVLRHMRQQILPAGTLVIAHLEGSRILNRMHRKAGEPVKGDRIPSFSKIEALFAGAGFTVEQFRDRDDGYFLLARLKNH